MNTDYWCFGSRYPRSTRNNNPLIPLSIDPLRVTQTSSNMENLSPARISAILIEKQTRWAVVSWFFFNDRSYSLSSKVGLTPSRLSPGTFSRSREADPVSDRSHLPRQMGVVIVSSWRKRYTQTPYYRVERSIRLLRSVQCFAGWEAGSESYVDVDGDGEIGSGW